MALILCLETSTKSCSVALASNGKLIAQKESVDEKYSRAENLTLYIEEVCKQSSIKLTDIDAVAVSKGPGSFTGLRIGVSTAKGLCYALNKPLIAVSTLEAMTAGQIANFSFEASTLFCPMIDAKRMEVYCAIYDSALNELKKVSADIINETSFAELLALRKIIFFGDGAEKCKTKIIHSNAIFLNNVYPSAKNMIALAENQFTQAKFEDVAYFEPYYLKDFVTTHSTS